MSSPNCCGCLALILSGLKENKIDFVSKEDYTLHDIGTILKDNNKPYLKYTPFYKKSILKIPNSINSNTKFKFIKDSSSFTLKQMEDKLKPKEKPKKKKLIIMEEPEELEGEKRQEQEKLKYNNKKKTKITNFFQLQLLKYKK